MTDHKWMRLFHCGFYPLGFYRKSKMNNQPLKLARSGRIGMAYFFVLTCFLIIGLQTSVMSKISVQTLPTTENPKQILFVSDSLELNISMDWQLTITSLVYKPKNLNFIQPAQPMPIVQIDNPWILHNVGFAIRTAQVKQKPDSVIILIKAISNYIENPFQLFIRLGFSEQSQLAVKIWLENHYQAGLSDIYRQGKAGVTPGIPWLSFLSPDPGGKRRILYPVSEKWNENLSLQDSYVLEEFTDSYAANVEPTEDEYPKPVRKPVIMRFYHQPAVPLTLEYPDIKMGVFIFKENSDLDWKFDNIKQALWPSQRKSVPADSTLLIFKGVIGLFQGDWHYAFDWFRQKIRKNFDFTYYKRPGYEKYRKDFLAFHSFVYNHELYDPVKNSYRIKEFLLKAKQDYDGFDQFYLWHAYPRVGVDPRDQFDLFYDLPGGLNGLREFIEIANSLGTHVYLAYNPWDIIGRKKDMYGEMAKIVGEVKADGLLLDTMGKSDLLFRTKVDQFNPDAQFVTEGRPDINGLVVTTSSWDHKLTKDPMPYVDLLRFIIPEHRAFQINRWDRDRVLLIKKALFNTTGYTVWNDIFGEINLQSWDEKILLSRYHRTMHDFAHVLNTAENEPLLDTFIPSLYVNGFFSNDMHFYTLYQDFHNFTTRHKEHRIIGPLFQLEVPDGWHMIDVWNKYPLEIREKDGIKIAFMPLEMPEEVGCLVAMPERIQIEQSVDSWTAYISGEVKGTLELIGVDSGMRNEMVKEVGTNSQLTFNRMTANPTPAGYVMIQYRNENKEVKDVALISVGF
jgi:hypothetical protein